MTRADPHRHCGTCGGPFADLTWPRACAACGATTWRNPTPVAVLVVPVLGGGVVLIRRRLAPPGLALPGGFVDHGESWQAAAARELREEAGLVVDPGGVRHARTVSSPDGTRVLIFGVSAPVAELPPWTPGEPNHEIDERLVTHAPIELVFPLHTDVLRAWFAGKLGPP